MREMAQRSIAASIDSRPAVKFRLTTTLPATATAILASAPPTDAGSSRPMSACEPVRRRTARARSRLAMSARPKVSSRPVESAIANDDQRRLAV